MLTAPLFPDSYVVFDFETSDFLDQGGKVIEMSALRVRNGKPEDPLQLYVQHDGEISEGASKIHGITKEVLAEKGTERTQAWWLFHEYCGDDLPMVGYNCHAFDFLAVDGSYKHFKYKEVGPTRRIDVAMLWKGLKFNIPQKHSETHFMYCNRVCRVRLPKGSRFNLVSACQELGIDISKFTAHQADSDVFMTDLVYRKLTGLPLPTSY